MPKTSDPYEILGVSRSASQDDIKRAYRRLAKEFHPDRNPGNKAAEQRFKEIQAAYEVLGDPQRRAQFDRFGAGGPAPEFRTWSSGTPGGVHFETGPGVDFDFGDLSSIFEQFFSRGTTAHRGGRRTAGPTRRQKGGDLEYTLEIGFEEAARGSTRDLTLRADGAGNLEQLRVRIPSGVEDDQRIRVRGRGQEGPGGRGDLYIRVRVAAHPYFRRDKLDILLDLPLAIHEATFGAKVDIPTLDGPTRLVIPPGTPSGAKLRLREKGILDERTQRRGDMFAVVRIVPPRDISAEAQGLLERFAQLTHFDPRAGAGWRL